MRKRQYIGRFLLFFLLLMIALPVSAQSGWELQWGSQNSDGSITLTESKTNDSGSYVKSAPVDTRKGFTLSFDYLIDQVENGPSADMGIAVNFSEKPVLSFNPYSLYYGIRFLNESNSTRGYVVKASLVSGYGALPQDDVTGNAISPLEYGEWHSVQIKYTGGVLEVWEGGLLLCRSSKFRIPDMTYVGICARTDYYPRERHMIRNVSFTGAPDAALVYLNANGGVCETKSIYAVPGETADLTENVSRTGYTFKGWYAEPSCVNRVDGRSFSWSQGQTIYAGWTPEQYKVTLDPRAEGVKTRQITVSYEKPYGTLPTPKLTGLPSPTRKGYRFDGWYTEKYVGAKVTASSKTTKVLPGTTLYAHWKRGSSSGSGSGGSDDDSDSGKSKYRLPCLSCDGSGKCSACGGDGYRWSYAMDNERLNCYKCNGSGRCTACGGSGKR